MPDLSIGYDTRGAPEALQRGFIKPSEAAKRAALDLERGVERTSKAIRGAGREQQTAAQKAERYGRTQRLVAQIMRETGVTHTTAARAVRVFGQDLDKAEKKASTYARQMDRAEKEVKQLAAAQRAASGTSLTAHMQAQSKATAALASGFRNLAASLGIVAGAAGLAAVARSIVNTGMQFEQFRAQLETVVGPGAEQAFAFLREFATQTPFELSNLTEAFIRLKSVGIDPTEQVMQALGDTAAAMGKDITQFAQAVVGASTGEMEMLKQFGIVARQQGDIVRFTFKGVTTEVGRNAQEIVQFLVGLGQTQFAGGMERQTKTLQGAVSNLKDAWAEFANELFQGGFGQAAQDVVRSLTEILKSSQDVARVIGQELGDAVRATAKVVGLLADNWQLLAIALAAIKWPAIVAGVNSLTVALMANPLIAGGVALAAAIHAITVALNHFSDKGISEALDETLKMADAAAEMEAAIKSQNKELLSGAIDKYKGRIRDLHDAQQPLIDQIGRQKQQLALSNEAWLEAWGTQQKADEAREGTIKSLNEANAELAQNRAELTQLNGIVTEGEQALKGYKKATGGAGTSTDNLSKKVKEARDNYQEMIFRLRETISISEAFRASSELAEQAQKFLADGIASTVEEALAMAKELAILKARLEQLSEASTVRMRILADLDEMALDSVERELNLWLVNLQSGLKEIEITPRLEAGQTRTSETGSGSSMTVLSVDRATSFTDKLRDGMKDASDVMMSGLVAAGEAFALSLIDSSFSFQDAMQQLLPQLGAAIGQTIGSSFGELGGQVGGALGGVVGQILGNLFRSGATQATARLKVVDEQLVAIAETVQGDLGPALRLMADNITQTVNQILAEFGGSLQSGEFGFLIRPDENIVRVFYLGLTAEFENQAEAASFLVAQILANSVVTGLGASVEEALRSGDFASADELVGALRFAEGIDAALREPWANFVAAAARESRLLLSAAADLGINIQRATLAAAAHVQAMIDEHAAHVNAAAGVDSMVGQWTALQESIRIVSEEGVKELQEDLLEAARAAQDQAAAAQAMADSLDHSRDVFTGTRESFEEMLAGMGLGADIVERMGERWQEMAEAGLSAEEIVEELTVTLEGLDSQRIRQAIDRFRAQFVGSLFRQLADLADQAGMSAEAAKLRAKAEEFEFKAKIIGIRVTLQAALAQGLLSAATVQAANQIIQAAQQAWNELRRSGLGAGSGRAGGAGRRPPATTEPTGPTVEENLEDLRQIAAAWNSMVTSIRRSDLAGAVRDSQARAAEAWAQALEIASSDPDVYSEAAQAAADAIAAGLEAELHEIGRDALGALGSEFVRIRREGAAAVQNIRFLMNNLEALGLTARQVGLTVLQAVLPPLLAAAIAEAERVGDIERATHLRERQAEIERKLMLLQISMWEAQLIAAGMLSEEIMGIITDLRADLDRPTGGIRGLVQGLGPAGTDDVDVVDGRLVPAAPDTRSAAGRAARRAAGEGGTAAQQERTADILAQLTRDAMTNAERLADDWRLLQERIEASAGSELERIEARQLAEEAYHRERLAGLRELQEELLGEQRLDLPAARAVEQAQAAFRSAVAGGDEEEALRAAREWLAAARDFPTLYRDARAQILAAIGPLTANLDTGQSLGNLPSPETSQLTSLTGPGQNLSVPQITVQAPNFGPLERKVDALTAAVAALQRPTLEIEKNTRDTASRVLPLRDMESEFARRL